MRLSSPLFFDGLLSSAYAGEGEIRTRGKETERKIKNAGENAVCPLAFSGNLLYNSKECEPYNYFAARFPREWGIVLRLSAGKDALCL